MSSTDEILKENMNREDIAQAIANATQWIMSEDQVDQNFERVRARLESLMRNLLLVKTLKRAYVYFVGSSKGLEIRSGVRMENFVEDYLRIGTNSEGELEAYSYLTTSYVSFIMERKRKHETL